MPNYDKQQKFIDAVEKLLKDCKDVLDFGPGQLLLDMLEKEGVSQAELSRRSPLNTRTISTLIHGGRSFTPDTCLALQGAGVVGVKAEVFAFISAVHTIRLKRAAMKASLRE